MHSLSSPDESLYRTWRHPNGAAHYFDDARAQVWIRDYNTTADPDALEQLLAHVEPLAKSLLAYRSSIRFEAQDELLSRIRIKIWKSVGLYDPSRGSPYSFCSMIVVRTAMSVVSEVWSRQDRFVALEEADRCTAPADACSREAIAEIEHRVRQVKTSCTDPFELEAQRWFIKSFIDCGFHIRRHEAADSAMKVYGLDHARSRQLFDLTMVAVRRELLPNHRLHRIGPLDLRGGKSAALIKFAKYLSSDEFTRLAVLLRDVAPSVVYTIRPENALAIRYGHADAIRSNLLVVLHGAETDRPLFFT